MEDSAKGGLSSGNFLRQEPDDFGGNAHRGTRWYLMQNFGGPFHIKIAWAETGLIEAVTEGSVFLLFVHWNEVHIGELSDVLDPIWQRLQRLKIQFKKADVTDYLLSRVNPQIKEMIKFSVISVISIC